jgi:hypothetical protein
VSLYIQETYVNATEGHRFYDGEVYETSSETTGELYRRLRDEYGRCTGKVYIDKPDGGAQAVGWVFIGRQKYEDTGEPYLREVWVTVHERAPETKTKKFYADLDKS